MAGIYIHIPFCKQACHYCDFHFSTGEKQRKEVMEAIESELILRRDYLSNQQISTIYFGGGTPSQISINTVQRLLSTVHKYYSVGQTVETSLEANPDDLSSDYLKGLYASGINRLSLGIQSFDDTVLRWMNRAHNQLQAEKGFERARTVGFKNISIDLIYGIPLAEHNLRSDLQKGLALKPDHISAYHLTIEPGTVFGHQLNKGIFNGITEDKAAEQFSLTRELLTNNGFVHYEVSNFALPNYQSQHNLGYWEGQHYLGIGPSAHSFNGHSRQYNIANNGIYLKALSKGKLPFTLEELTPQQRINERIMLGLRTSDGVDLNLQADNFTWDLNIQSPQYLTELQQNGLALISKNRLQLTNKGILLADRIAEDLFIP